MRKLAWLGVGGVFILAAATGIADDRSTGGLSRADEAGGWKTLFGADGSTAAWKAYRKDGFPEKGWVVRDGALVILPGGGGDLVTVDEYGDFELEFEWRVAEKANSGVIYRVSENNDWTWQSGPEYQVLDDAGNDLKPDHPHSAGGLYDIDCPSADKVVKPVGEFNQGRIRIRDGVLQHWLNGKKVLERRIDTPEWKERIAKSKFRSFSEFGVMPRGRIALQDHGTEVAYRNIRIRDFDAPLPNETKLFNGKDFTGWVAHLNDDAPLDAAWSVKDGIIVCKGNPIGYIRTTDKHTSFVLMLQWRFSPETKKTGNGGVLLRVQEPDKVWPRSVEAQLLADSAGDFWNIEEFKMTTDAARLNGRNTRKTHGAERPVGEWNEYEIIVDGPKVTLKVNGEVLNEAWDVEELPGYIAIQSEGTEMHFRNIRLSPLK